MLSAICFSLDHSKLLLFANGIKKSTEDDISFSLECSQEVRFLVHKNSFRKYVLSLSQMSPVFCVSAVQVFGKLCGKGRNCS